MIDAVHDGAAARRVRRRRRRREAVRRATARRRRRRPSSPPRPRCAPAATSRAGSSPAAARTPTRSSPQGFQCVNLANGTERNHEPTERVSVAALEGMLDVASRCSTRPRPMIGARCRDELALRAPGGATVFEGAIVDVCEGTFRHEDGEEVTRQWVVASRRGRRSSPTTASTCGSCASRARRSASPDLLELPAGKLDEEGESPLECGKRELAEEIGKAAATWEHLNDASTPRPGFTDEQCHVFLATDLRDEPGHEIEDERIDIEAQPLAELDALIAESQRREDAHRPAAAARAACAVRRLNGGVAPGRRRASRRRTLRARGRHDAAPARPSRSSTCCSTSSPTSSSSAGCRATRSRPTAPTCCSSATASTHAATTRSPPATRDLSAFADELAAGREDRPPAAPATLQRKAACLRSFYRHLRRTAVLDRRPDRRPARAAQSRKLPAGAQPRRGRRAAAPAARAPSRRRCATARCSR